MYRWIVARLCRHAFRQLNAGQYEWLLSWCRADVTHYFAGDHALGGKRHSVAGVRRWFRRLDHLFPVLEFHVHDVLVKGPPWNTRAVVRWTDTGRLRTGEPYKNHGVHLLRFQWGRVAAIEAHLDTQTVERACAQLAGQGITEAQAQPIED